VLLCEQLRNTSEDSLAPSVSATHQRTAWRLLSPQHIRGQTVAFCLRNTSEDRQTVAFCLRNTSEDRQPGAFCLRNTSEDRQPGAFCHRPQRRGDSMHTCVSPGVGSGTVGVQVQGNAHHGKSPPHHHREGPPSHTVSMRRLAGHKAPPTSRHLPLKGTARGWTTFRSS
jgi:hypothetical protein